MSAEEPSVSSSDGGDDVRVEARDVLLEGYFHVEQVTLRHRRRDGTMSRAMQRMNLDRGHGSAILLHDPAATLARVDPQYQAIEQLYRAGPYPNGETLRGATPFASFRSRELPGTAGVELGSIRLRGSGWTRLCVLRRAGGAWRYVPGLAPWDPDPLIDDAARVARDVVDAGLGEGDRWGPLRYELHLLDGEPADRPVRDSPIVEAVSVTTLGPPRTVAWRWR